MALTDFGEFHITHCMYILHFILHITCKFHITYYILSDLERKITRIHAYAARTGTQGVAEGAASQKRAVREFVAVIEVH